MESLRVISFSHVTPSSDFRPDLSNPIIMQSFAAPASREHVQGGRFTKLELERLASLRHF